MDTYEETLKRTYVDLAIYFTFCMQVKQFEQDSNLQFSAPHFIHYIDMTLLHIMRDIAAGLQDAHFVAQIPIVSRHCLSTELLRYQTQKQIIMKNLNSYFQSLRLFGLSAYCLKYCLVDCVDACSRFVQKQRKTHVHVKLIF